MLPISDSKSRVGARVMSFSCVPITWLRSTAVWALASSTIACDVGPLGDAEVLATRVAPPAHSTSPPLTISWRTE